MIIQHNEEEMGINLHFGAAQDGARARYIGKTELGARPNYGLNAEYRMIHATANGIRNAALRKMTDDYRAHGELSAKWYTVVAPVNDCALMTMHEAVEKIKESPKWKKRGIRSACEDCLRMEDRYTKQLMRELEYNDGYNIDRRQFLMDYLDSWQDAWNHDTFILRMCVSQYLLKVRYPRDVELASYILTAYNVLVFACQFFDIYLSICRENFGIDLWREFADRKLEKMKDRFSLVADSITTEEVIGLNEDTNTRNAVQALYNRVSSSEIANDAAGKALDFNLDVKHWAENIGNVVDADCKWAEETLKKHLGLQ